MLAVVRSAVVLGTLGLLGSAAEAEEDLAQIAREAALVRIDRLAQVKVDGRSVDELGLVDRLRVIEYTSTELRGLHCDLVACLVVTVDPAHVEQVLQEPLEVELGDEVGIWFNTGATVRGGGGRSGHTYVGDSFWIRAELIGATVGTTYAEDPAPFEVISDVSLPTGTRLLDDDGDPFAYLSKSLPARRIRETEHGWLVEVTDGWARVVGHVRATNPVEDGGDDAPAGKRRTSFSTRLVAGTVLRDEPGGDPVGVTLRPTSVRRVDSAQTWSQWAAWTVVVDGVIATVWTSGEPLVKNPKSKPKKKKKRKKKRARR
jgi:hypothetical protein